MKILIENEERTVVDIVKEAIDGDGYEKGQLEAARATADKCATFLGRLTNLLCDNRLLEEKDVLNLVEFLDW